MEYNEHWNHCGWFDMWMWLFWVCADCLLARRFYHWILPKHQIVSQMHFTEILSVLACVCEWLTGSHHICTFKQNELNIMVLTVSAVAPGMSSGVGWRAKNHCQHCLAGCSHCILTRTTTKNEKIIHCSEEERSIGGAQAHSTTNYLPKPPIDISAIAKVVNWKFLPISNFVVCCCRCCVLSASYVFFILLFLFFIVIVVVIHGALCVLQLFSIIKRQMKARKKIKYA